MNPACTTQNEKTQDVRNRSDVDEAGRLGVQVEASDAMAAVLIDKLLELGGVVGRLSDEQYAQNPVGLIPSSIGGHVRHALDHVRALIEAASSGRLDFDARARGTPVEKETRAAAEMIEDLSRRLAGLSSERLNMNVELSMMVGKGVPVQIVGSNLRRELGYVLSHLIHHNAIISNMVVTLGGTLPPGFGYAPATVEYQNRTSNPAQASCVR